MRLLLTTDAVGGVWTYALDVAGAFAGRGIELVVAIMGPSPEATLPEISGVRFVDTGLPLDWLAPDAATVERSSEALAQLAADHRVDLVQLHAAALAIARFPVPVLTVVHSDLATWWAAVRDDPLPADFVWRTDQTRDGLARSGAIVAPTAAFSQAVQRQYGLNAAPVAVHNGRAPNTHPPAPQSDTLLTVGRLWDEGKNVATLDRAAAHISVPLHAVGALRGPNGAAIKLDHAEALGVLSADALAAHLAARPIFASAALYEPFGLSVLEAAQAGCALLLSDIPTFRELWSEAALFVEPRDAAGFAAAAETLLASSDERARLGEAARQRAARYTVDATADAMLNQYRALLPDADRRAA